MIISPPFLPEPGALGEAAWLDAAMAPPIALDRETLAPEGSYPLSRGLAWHNGAHLQASRAAPESGATHLSVRAVADGRVAYAHPPTPPDDSPDHPLNHNPFDSAGGPTWTSDGFVVIAHTTEIGAASGPGPTPASTPTEVTFYSVCMHLASLALNPRTRAPWKASDPIHRKEALGEPGRIYGHAGQIHFEICCDEANLRQFLGRAPRWVDPLDPPAPTADGRTDSVFGRLHFFLPKGTPTRSAPPTQHLRATGAATDAGASPDTLSEPQWVRLTYAKGSATLASFDRLGAPLGTPHPEPDFEYNLHAEATRRHASLDAPTQAASSPSGWYELLRFGRLLGTDPLPETAAHWRQIPTPGGTVWADLNAPGTRKFSDADFPAVAGWNCFDDDTSPNDQRCDSLRLKTLIRDPDPANAQRMEIRALTRRLGRAEVREKLRRAICKFPGEWDRTTIEARHGWLRSLPLNPGQDEAGRAKGWQRFTAHARALSFEDLPPAFVAAQWRFHPREFIGVMRTCGWLCKDELIQLMPRNYGLIASQQTKVPWDIASSRLRRYVLDLNKTFRKYLIDTAARQTHFLAQTYIETAMWRTMKEIGEARQQTRRDGSRYWPAPAMEYYQAFFGRGVMQLTWASNYETYGNFRSFRNVEPTYAYGDIRINQTSLHYWEDPRTRDGRIGQRPRRWAPRFDPSIISENTFNACDSGAHYWVSKNIGRRNINIHRVCDLGVNFETVGRISVLVNGGSYGYRERQGFAAFIGLHRGDTVDHSDSKELQFPMRHGTGSCHVDFTPQRQP